MSTERLSFGFNSLIPETYKSKAEALAKCLQHKLLSLGGIDTSSTSYSTDPRKRLSTDNQSQEDKGNLINQKSEYFTKTTENPVVYQQNGEDLPKDMKITGINISEEASQKTDKTDNSDDEFFSHSESENSDLAEAKKSIDFNFIERTKQKLISMGSEDSTVDSWCSCQDNLNDFEKCDSENEDANNFASQIKGSPKLRNWNLRSKRKEIREKPGRRNSKKNHSSSTENVDSENMYRQGFKPKINNSSENFDSESHDQYILLDGLDLEDDEVPHRVLRESSSTSNLEKHFSRTCSEDSLERDLSQNRKLKNEMKVNEKLIFDKNETLTWVDERRNTLTNSDEFDKIFQIQKESPAKQEAYSNAKVDLMNRINFAKVASEVQEADEVEAMKDFIINDISRTVKKIGGLIVECPSNNNNDKISESDNTDGSCKTCEVLVTSVEVLSHEPDEEDDQETVNSESEKVPIIVESHECSEKMENKPPEDDDTLSTRSKLRRCSSLKTWKTPPGTPGAKKIVRFADALGLDLADVRTFLDEIPKVPSSAYEDLHFDIPSYTEPPPPVGPIPTLIPIFQQPGNKMDFLEKVQQQKICLETALVTETTVLTVTGYVRVQNMSFHKSVHVRYSINNWETFSDLQATYVPNSCDGFSDKFSFILYGHTLKIGQKLEFALRLECSGSQYWDNNGGINYVFNCLPQTSANNFFSSLHASSSVDPWHDFY